MLSSVASKSGPEPAYDRSRIILSRSTGAKSSRQRSFTHALAVTWQRLRPSRRSAHATPYCMLSVPPTNPLEVNQVSVVHTIEPSPRAGWGAVFRSMQGRSVSASIRLSAVHVSMRLAPLPRLLRRPASRLAPHSFFICVRSCRHHVARLRQPRGCTKQEQCLRPPAALASTDGRWALILWPPAPLDVGVAHQNSQCQQSSRLHHMPAILASSVHYGGKDMDIYLHRWFAGPERDAPAAQRLSPARGLREMHLEAPIDDRYSERISTIPN